MARLLTMANHEKGVALSKISPILEKTTLSFGLAYKRHGFNACWHSLYAN